MVKMTVVDKVTGDERTAMKVEGNMWITPVSESSDMPTILPRDSIIVLVEKKRVCTNHAFKVYAPEQSAQFDADYSIKDSPE